MKVKEQIKAIGGAAVAGLTALGAALAPPETAVTALELVGVLVTTVGTYVTVYGLGQPVSLTRLPHLTAAELRAMAVKAAERELAEQAQ